MQSFPDKTLAAMVALRPLPGSPEYDGDDAAIIRQALEDTSHYLAAGVDAIVLENSCDLPYVKPPLPDEALEVVRETAREVRSSFAGPLGLQLLEAANESALEIAAAAAFDFIRVEGYVFAHVGGAGIIEGCAGTLLRRRKALGCPHLKVFGDVKKKHCSHALTADLSVADVVRQSEFFLVDGIIVTGARTGQEPDVASLREAGEAATVPVWIGSGMTPENIRRYVPLADGFIVGSTFREGGRFLGRLVPERLHAFVDAFRAAG